VNENYGFYVSGKKAEAINLNTFKIMKSAGSNVERIIFTLYNFVYYAAF
jgi:hypothetical protein